MGQKLTIVFTFVVFALAIFVDGEAFTLQSQTMETETHPNGTVVIFARQPNGQRYIEESFVFEPLHVLEDGGSPVALGPVVNWTHGIDNSDPTNPRQYSQFTWTTANNATFIQTWQMWDNDKTLTFHGKPRSMYRFGEPDQFIEFNETLTTTVAGGALKLSYEIHNWTHTVYSPNSLTIKGRWGVSIILGNDQDNHIFGSTFDYPNKVVTGRLVTKNLELTMKLNIWGFTDAPEEDNWDGEFRTYVGFEQAIEDGTFLVLLREQLQTFDVPLDIQTGHLFRHADYDPDFSILFRGVESSPDMPPQDGNVEVAVGVSIGVVAAVAIAATAGIFVIRKRRMTKVSKSIHERLAIDGGLGHSEAKTPAPTPDHGGVDEQEAGATGWSLGSKNVALKNTVSG